MTLCIAWVRKKGISDEVCVIADSCFTGGQRFLAAPKIFPLDRGDCVIACAGDTMYSFPVIEHIRQAIPLNQGLKERAIDLSDLLHSIRDITNKVLFQETEKQVEGPNFSMIIAGYSWKLKKPIIQELRYKRSERRMVLHTPKTIKRTPFAVIGDEVSAVRRNIFLKLEAEGIQNNEPVDMQPLDTLLEYIRNTDIRSIGGVPQMAKVYPCLNILPFGFLNQEKQLFHFGRPLMDYETYPFPIIDLTTREQVYMKTIRDEFERRPDHPEPLHNFPNH